MNNTTGELAQQYVWTKKEINQWVKAQKGLEIRVDDRYWRIEWKSIGAGLYKVRFRCIMCFNSEHNEYRDIANNSLLNREMKWE